MGKNVAPLDIHVRHIGIENMTIVSKLSLLFVLSGDLQLLHNGKSVNIGEGEIYLVNQNDTVSVPSVTDNMVIIVHLWSNHRFKLNDPLSPIYMNKAYGHISRCLSQALGEYIKQNPGVDDIIQGYTHQLMGYLHRYLPEIKEDSRINQVHLSSKIREITDFILHHFDEKLTLDSLSEQFFISKFYLSHLFKEEIGISIGQFIKQVRLTRSIDLLYQGTFSLDEIAMKSGFPSVRAFREAFKEKYNVTPTQYQLNHKTNMRQEPTFELAEQEIYQLLNRYAENDILNQVVGHSFDVVEEVIDIRSLSEEHFHLEGIAKMDVLANADMLPVIKHDLAMHYIAVTHPLRKIQANYDNDQWHIQLNQLHAELTLICSNGFIPYIQIGIEEYDDFKAMYGLSDLAWVRLFDSLNQVIRQRFAETSQWYIEYRCFYENINGGELCLPLVRLIEDTGSMYQVVIHLPKLPISHQKIKQPVMVIDDRSRVKTYDLADILDRLHHKDHLERIAENKNILLQQLALNHFGYLEEDEHYRPLMSLITANQTLWFFNMELDKLSTHFFQPTSIDGTSLYTYFPKELSQKLALISEAGIYQDMWYAYQFKTRLYEHVIYQTEFFILTKRGEDYRLLATYPEKKINNLHMISSETIKQQPFMLLNITLLSLNGRYKQTTQELSPYTKMEYTSHLNWIDDVKLSQEDVDYINGLTKPKREVKVLETKGRIVLDIQVPILGMVYVDLKKIK